MIQRLLFERWKNNPARESGELHSYGLLNMNCGVKEGSEIETKLELML